MTDFDELLDQAAALAAAAHTLALPQDGRDGRDGREGKDGRDGFHGKDGATGLRGLPGIPGAAGKDGARGPRGEPGPEGPEGPVGPMPISEWDSEGVRVRFEVEPGVWGPWSEKLRGPSGRNGANAGAGTVSFRSVGGGGAFDDVGVIGGGGSDFSPSAVFGGGGASSGATLVINGGRA